MNPIIPKGILRDPAYLIHLRSEPCLFTGLRAHDEESVVPAHLGTAGKGIKSPDNEAIPVLSSVHRRMHGGEISVLRIETPNWLIRAAFRAYARELYAQYQADMAEKTL